MEIMSGIALMNLVPWCISMELSRGGVFCSCFTITLCQFLTVGTIQIINSIYISMKIMKNYETIFKESKIFVGVDFVVHFNQPHISRCCRGREEFVTPSGHCVDR